jgi:replicative superfamily II helicase
MGVNTPAWSVIIAGLEHPDSPYSIAEYKNMVGRAGRLGYTPRGKSFLIAPTMADAHRLWNQYVIGTPESLESRFADQEPLSLICRVLATAGASRTDGLTQQELIDFVQSTFGAHQRGTLLSDQTISANLNRLLSAGLVEQIDTRIRLTELGKIAGELGIQVESVVRIGRALRALNASEVHEKTIIAAAQISGELDDIFMPVHRKSIQERQRWQGALYGYGLPGNLLRELQATDDATYTARCKKLAAVLMWIEGIELNQIEASLLRHLPSDNAAGPIRSTAERTRDLVGVVSRIAALVSADRKQPAVDLDELSSRLELGVPKDIVWLANALKRNLERGDYIALRRARLVTLEALVASDDAILKQLLPSLNKRQRIREAVEKIRSLQEKQKADDALLPMPKA